MAFRTIATLLAFTGLAIALPFTLPIKDGQPLLRWQSDKLPQLPQIPVLSPSKEREVTLYRWQDNQGQWHYSDTPPTDRPSERQVIDPNTNLIPALPPEQTRESEPSQPSAGNLLQQSRQLQQKLDDSARLRGGD
jgi:hypothetical protein